MSLTCHYDYAAPLPAAFSTPCLATAGQLYGKV